jgi:S1-C subfamily serine protease
MQRPTLCAYVALTVLALAFQPVTSGAELRLWRDSKSLYQVHAELIEFDGDTVRLKRKDNGKIVSVPFAVLSEVDRAYLKQLPRDKRGSQSFPKLPATAKALETAARKKRTAKAGLALYDAFLASESTDQREKEQAKLAQKWWSDAAKADKVRVGSKWITRDEHRLILQREREIIALADQALLSEDFATAEKWLKESTRTNPAGIVGSFRLAIAYALHPTALNAEEAEKHFSECVRRRIDDYAELGEAEKANLIASLNNLAIAKIRLREPTEALRQWQRSLNLRPATPQILHNLSRLKLVSRPIGSARSGGPNVLYLATADLRLLTTLLAEAQSVERAFDRSRGWRYMRLVDESGLDPNDNQPQPNRPESNLVPFAAGSGVIVGPGLVLTNRHVVEKAAAIEVAGSDAPAAYHRAKLLHLSADSTLDLALLECEPLQAKPARLALEPLRLSAEVRALGFPEPQLLGSNIKVTSGIVTALPPLLGFANPDFVDYLMHDAVILGGNSGGPVSNRKGEVVGLNTATYKSAYSLAVPAARCLNYLNQHAAGRLPNGVAPSEPVDWEEAVDRVRTATVQIVALANPDEFDPRTKKFGEMTWDAFDDPWCIACYGRNALECPDRECANGGVRSTRLDVARFPDGSAIVQNTKIRIRCKVCSGKGIVSCPYCRYGFDDTFVNPSNRAWLERYLATLVRMKQLGLLE